jgi:hypothetical protein
MPRGLLRRHPLLPGGGGVAVHASSGWWWNSGTSAVQALALEVGAPPRQSLITTFLVPTFLDHTVPLARALALAATRARG